MHSSDNELNKYLQELIQLEEDLMVANTAKDQLHVRYASIITDTPLFELNIPIELLEDEMYTKIESYFHNLETLVDDDVVTLGEKMDLSLSKQKYILQSDVEEVCNILGIDGVTDSTYYRSIMGKLIDLHNIIIQGINDIILSDGKRSEYYFGTKFFPKLQGTKFAFSIDNKDKNVYLMNYSVDDDIPIIYRYETDDTILTEAIRLIAISQDDLELYTTY